MIFDTHAHYDDEVFNEDREELLANMSANGVGHIVSVGASPKTSKAALELAHKYDFIYAAIGTHPYDVEDLNEAEIQWLIDNAADPKVVAIGEMGLDYHYDEPSKELQEKWFRRQIEVAKQVNLPVIIHSRDAAEDTMKIIKETNLGECGGVIHCYSYSAEMAREYVDMGFYIGVGGVVTFKNGKKLKEVVRNISLDNIVIETDCPYLSPEPHRGERNDSTNLKYVVTQIADLKGVSEDEVIRVTEENAKKMYRI
ncbi:TatD family hydrolase [Eubacterium xylanophilum]|uniref:TatD family hydrolase n=1 Tax=Eubacterium xylanophilum TaxID=39497 RepID=UPI00047DA5EA|nr:TatD family hydrolase [Eubacterium xylanophilum]